MADKKAVTLEQFEIAKSYIDRKDAENIKSAEFVDDTLKFYASSDKSGDVVAEITLPEETFLDSSKTELVSEFSWSITKYPKSTNPELDGKAVLVLAVKTGRTVRYSFISLDSVVARLVGGDTESMSASVVDDVVTFAVNVSEIADNRVVIKDDGLYVGTVDNAPTWTVSTDDEINELFPLSDEPVISADSLGAREVGEVVKIMEDGVPTDFIVVHKGNPNPEMYDASCDGVWLLKKTTTAIDSSIWNGSYQNNDYENSTISTWLNDKYLNCINEEVRKKIKSIRIPYVKGLGNSTYGVQSGADGLSCNIFLLSACEVGGTESELGQFVSFPINEGSVLDYFDKKSIDDKKQTRICYNVDSESVHWWLRSPYHQASTGANLVYPNGQIASINVSVKRFSRPAFILPYTAKVNSDGLVTG